jgi:foldase protein PrsA
MSAPKVAPLLVLALAGGAAAQEPDEPALPADAVARVDDRVIERSQFRHWNRAARRGSGETSERALRRMTMSFLISAEWIQLEAERRGIRVTSSEVRREFRRQRRASFRNRREYRRFLRTSGQTEADLRYRVRLDLLSVKVRRDVLRGVTGTRRRQRRLDRFVVRFRTRWRGQTVCARAYRVGDCGSVA